MSSSPLLARLLNAIRTISEDSRLGGVGSMSVMLVLLAGFGTSQILANNHDVFAQESQEEITTYYDTGLIL